MSISTLNGHTVAVCISQPVLSLVMPGGPMAVQRPSTPLLLNTTSTPAPTVLGFDGQRPPTYTGLARQLTAEEIAAEAIFVTAIPEYVPLLREAGYRGQILTPGVVRRQPDGTMAAHHSTVTVLADAVDPLQGYSPDEIVVGPGEQTLAQASAEERQS